MINTATTISFSGRAKRLTSDGPGVVSTARATMRADGGREETTLGMIPTLSSGGLL
jgi:hypothetical protein